MKRVTLLFLFFCVTFTTHAQKDSIYQALIKNNYGTSYIALPEKKIDAPPPVFSNIRVVDLRRDTSRVGLVSRRLAHRQIRFRRPLSAAMSAYLNQNYANPKAGRSLLVVIKDLWLYDRMYDMDSTLTQTGKIDVYTQWQGNMAFRYEAYLPTADRFIPITFLDTTITSADHTSVSMGEVKLPELLFTFMNKVAAVDLDAITKRKRTVTYDQIDSFSRTRYNYPMDTATAFKKGVYANVDEFLNNTPSIPDYEIIKNRDGEMLLNIRDKDGKFYYTHTMWGFSDGDYCYKMMDGTLSPILLVQHAFYVYGANGFITKKIMTIPTFYPDGRVMYPGQETSLPPTKIPFLYRLDVRSGEITQ